MYKTKVADLYKDFENAIELGAKLIAKGDLVAFPTETVYGLGADALRQEAVSAIFVAKGRPCDNPVIVHVAKIEDAAKIAYVNQTAEALMNAFWPGPLTIVLPKRAHVPFAVTAGLNTVAIRMPDNIAALRLIEKAGVPIAAPSANISTKPSPTCAQHVFEDLNGKIPLILDGGKCAIGLESTVISIFENSATILRPGAITKEMLEKFFENSDIKIIVSKFVLSHCLENSAEKIESPGVKYTHYSPKANVTLFKGDIFQQAESIKQQYNNKSHTKNTVIFSTNQTNNFYDGLNSVIMGDREKPETICQNFFALLRQADNDGFEEILIEAIDQKEIGLAFMNRALRSAGFNIVES